MPGNARAVHVLEMHVAHSCNLSCESCSHYSNQRHKGLLAPEEAERWLSAWKRRVHPRMFTLLGGEPTINPALTDFVGLVRQAWPRAHIRLVTNGWFLHRHPSLPAALAGAGNTSMLISVHHGSQEYLAGLEPNLALARQWVAHHGIDVEIEHAYERWTRRYKGTGAAMEPYQDGAPEISWGTCVAKHCMQLHEGCLWKCAPLAYLGLHARRYPLSERWAPYLAYRPLPSDCSDDDLDAFLGRGAESYCGMCPAHPEHFELPLPLPGRGAAAHRSSVAARASTASSGAARPRSIRHAMKDVSDRQATVTDVARSPNADKAERGAENRMPSHTFSALARKRAVMFHIGRSGSTVVADLLAQHPEMQWDREIYTEEGNLRKAALEKAGAGTDRILYDPIRVLERHLAGARRPWYGFEVKFYHLRRVDFSLADFVEELERRGFGKDIVLVRRNFLRTIVSGMIASRTGTWHLRADRERAEPQRLRIDPAEIVIEGRRKTLLAFLNEYQGDFRLLKSMLSAASTLWLNYEEDVEADPRQAYRKIVEHLGIAPLPVAVRLKRINPQPLSELVENIDEIRAYLAGTGFSWMADG